jgi:DNA polymerase I-like protein with 3'-5' exonuclease and polymerase domains
MAKILDIEADDLLLGATTAWIIGWYDDVTQETKYWLNGDLGWQAELDDSEVVVGHNLTGYDLPLLKKLFNYTLPAKVRVRDTMLLSIILNYNRFPSRRHSLAEWGNFLHSPKGEFSDFKPMAGETVTEFWTRVGETMTTYWKQDIRLTNKVHQVVMGEFKTVLEKNKGLIQYTKAENAVNRWFAEAELYGWPFDVEAGTALLAKMEAELQATRDRLMPKLGNKTVAVDKKLGVVEPKKPKWLKSGAYDAHTCKWFGVDEWSGQDEDRLVEGPYSRVQFVDLDVNSISDVKIFLFRHGWVPLEYNTKPNPDGRGKIQTSPKITEDSLECMEGDGKLYCDFLTTSSRVGILKGWLRNCDENGRLHGAGFSIGTPSMRARHSIIVNVPAADSVWGKEMRSLFICTPGYTLVGCDSAGNQARGLAHYLKSPEYVDLLLHGDIHQYNADKLTEVLKTMGIDHKVPRSAAKRVLYAFLFGASGGKLWGYIFGKPDDKKGAKLKAGFTKAVPGFKALLDKLENIFGKTKTFGDGYIPGIAGNRIYCDSFHKLLVYLLQACEKATCAAALMLAVERLEAENIPYQPCIMMHDEIDFMVPDEYAERAAVIGKQAFVDGPKLFGIEIMDGDAKIGRNWYEIH